MSKKFLRLLVLLLAFWVTGGQWLVLQSVAWINMIRDYSHETTFSSAVENTFDGNHPCGLCRLIQKQRTAEEKQSKQADFKIEKANLYFLASTVLPITLLLLGKVYFKSTYWAQWSHEPLSPPPKTA